MQERVFITGCTGLLGGHLLVRLYLQGATIRALVRKTSSFEQLRLISDFYNVPFKELHRAVDWVYGDTMDYVGLTEALGNCGTVYHCAALVSFGKGSREALLKTNVQGTTNMVDASLANGVKTFCFVSSIAALGKESENDFINEETPRDVSKPVTGYSESKYLSELEVWRGAAEGLSVVVVNPGVILGPGLPNKGSLLIVNVGSKGIPFYVDSQTGYVDVRDVCRALMELVERKQFGKRFVMVSRNMNIKQLFTLIAAEYGKKGPSIHVGTGWLKLAAGLLGIVSWFTRKPSQLSTDTLHSIAHPEYYSSQLLQDSIGFLFTPMEDTIHDTVLFLKHLNKTQNN